MYRIKNIFFGITILLFLLSCVQDPIEVIDTEAIKIEKNSALIICEGLYGYNNAGLTYFSLSSGKSQTDVFQKINGYKLGDVANYAMILDSHLYVIVSTSRILYEISLKTLQVNRAISFNINSYPRQMTFDDENLYITDAYANLVYKINRKNLKIVDSVKVGAQPEGVCILDKTLYVVNSGWGDINADHPEASTIYTISLNTFKVISRTKTYLNPVEIIADTIHKNLYVTYYNLPSKKDSTGGIVEYNENMTEIRHFKGNFLRTKLMLENPILFSLIDNNPTEGKNINPGLVMIDLDRSSITNLIYNTNNKEFWYNFQIDEQNRQIWISNAIDFQSIGRVEVYNTNKDYSRTQLIYSFHTGINPNQILLLK